MSELLGEAKNVIYGLIAALFGIGGWVWRITHAKVEAMETGKASKADLQALAAKVDAKADIGEMDRQRDNIAKLFDKLDEYGRRAEDRHRELLTALHTGLAQKADK